MIKCTNCKSNKVIFKIQDSNYMIINECYNCNNIIHLFIDDYMLNYKEFNTFNFIPNNSNKRIDQDKNINLCLKHNGKQYKLFCFNCKINLCEECLLSHNSSLHSIKEIKNIIIKNDKEQIDQYKKELLSLKEEINNKIVIINQNNKNENEGNYLKLLYSLLNIIVIKELFLDLKINDEFINSYDIVSLKYLLDKYNKTKLNILLKNIKSISYQEKENDIKKYKNSIFYSINSIPDDKIIHSKFSGWVNHVIQLKNGNIMSAHWDILLVYKIDYNNKKLQLLQRININNGSINHIYEYKKNKILICDNKMKIVQLSPDNKNFKCLNILDYGRKIIPFIPDGQAYKGDKKFIFMCTPNGIKLYSYSDNDENEKDIENNNNLELGEVKNDLKFLGIFNNEHDYSAIIQINNKICGIYKVKNNFNNHFALWEINHDFNDEEKFDISKFKLLGDIKNVYCAIGRYSISKINDEYVAIGTMKNNYHGSYPNEKSGLCIISLDTVEIVQFIQTDEITSIECLKNGIILTGGKNLFNNNYYIKEWKYDEDEKEILYVGSKKMHSDFINTIVEVKGGFFMSCGRDGNIYIVNNYN